MRAASSLAAGFRRRLMKPGPASSAWSSQGEAGRTAISACASSRGLRLSSRASCMATLHAQSPCAACFGRSSAMMDAGYCGATRASACVSRSVRWDLIAADKREDVAAKKGAYYTLGTSDQVRDAIGPSLEAKSYLDLGRLLFPTSELDRVDIQMPAHRALGQGMQLRAPRGEVRLQRLARFGLGEQLRSLAPGQPRHGHRHRIVERDAGRGRLRERGRRTADSDARRELAN